MCNVATDFIDSVPETSETQDKYGSHYLHVIRSRSVFKTSILSIYNCELKKTAWLNVLDNTRTQLGLAPKEGYRIILPKQLHKLLCSVHLWTRFPNYKRNDVLQRQRQLLLWIYYRRQLCEWSLFQTTQKLQKMQSSKTGQATPLNFILVWADLAIKQIRNRKTEVWVITRKLPPVLRGSKCPPPSPQPTTEALPSSEDSCLTFSTPQS
jgi:hypothetical protein